jgi:hypothetical protein
LRVLDTHLDRERRCERLQRLVRVAEHAIRRAELKRCRCDSARAGRRRESLRATAVATRPASNRTPSWQGVQLMPGSPAAASNAAACW